MIHYKLILPILIVILTIMSVCDYSRIHYDNPYVIWVLYVLILFFNFRYIVRNKIKLYQNEGLCILVFLVWAMIGSIRGSLLANNYYDNKNLIGATFSMTIPLLYYYFKKPSNLAFVLNIWTHWMVPIFLGLFMWILLRDGYHYYLTPMLLLGCFLPELPRKWMWVFSFLLILLIVADTSARTQIISAILSLFFSSLLLIKKNYVSLNIENVLKYFNLFIVIVTFVLLFLGITGRYNIFHEIEEANYGRYTTEYELRDGSKREEDVSEDTRTFIYYDVINSAIDHNYVLFGNTLARGNDTSTDLFADRGHDLTGRYERFANEIGMLNIFTWLGLVGVILYSFIYLYASFLALTKSKNMYVKIMSSMVAFHFFYGWIEDYPAYKIHTFVIWMFISICFSPEFREMDDSAFKKWIGSIFSSRKKIQQDNNIKF